jgi:hypothetical protein
LSHSDLSILTLRRNNEIPTVPDATNRPDPFQRSRRTRETPITGPFRSERPPTSPRPPVMPRRRPRRGDLAFAAAVAALSLACAAGADGAAEFDYRKLSGIIIPGFASTQLRAWSVLDCPYSPFDFNPLDSVWLDTGKVQLPTCPVPFPIQYLVISGSCFTSSTSLFTRHFGGRVCVRSILFDRNRYSFIRQIHCD